MKRTRFLTLGGLLAAAALFIGINLAAQPTLRSARLDLTQRKINTLSEGSRKILQKIDKPITLKLFLTRSTLENFPGLKTYVKRVQEMLEEYTLAAGDKLKLELVDPAPFSSEEEQASKYGLQEVPIGPNQAGSFYFGLVALRDGRQETIPFFDPDRAQLLEYDISQLIYKLNRPQKIRVGLLNTLRMQGGVNIKAAGGGNGFLRPWAIIGLLRRNFDFRLLDTNLTQVPDNIDVLLLVQPKLLDDATLYAIDQFALRGGKVVAFVDPFSEIAAARNQGEVFLKITGMQRMLNSWGLRLEENKVVADLGAAQQVNLNRTHSGRAELISYVPWLELGVKQMAQDDPVTAQLNSIKLATAGSLVPLKNTSATVKPLIHSTKQAMLIDTAPLAYAPEPRRLLANFDPTGDVYTMAARVTGTLHSAFPDGPPVDKDSQQPVAPPDQQLKTSSKPANIVVVADTDMLYDRFWVQISGFYGKPIAKPISNNADLLVNAVEQLGGSEDLISIRSRGTYNRPFTLVEKLRGQAELKFRAKEQELRTQLRKTKDKLAGLQQLAGPGGSDQVLSPAQQQELEKFRQEQIRIRKELRVVQYQLVQSIERLQTLLKVINIGLVPVIIAIIAVVLAIQRRRRDRSYHS